jgi:hypothetical protein
LQTPQNLKPAKIHISSKTKHSFQPQTHPKTNFSQATLHVTGMEKHRDITKKRDFNNKSLDITAL